jgi:hypothetical protein
VCCVNDNTNGDGASTCSDCDAGKYSFAGASACTKCTAGTYAEYAATDCTNCTAGTYSLAEAALCTDCVAGKYSFARASVCTECAVGKYSETRCPVGWISMNATCFRKYSTPGSWETARQHCVGLGGNLAHPDNQLQQNLLRSMAGGVATWIGVNDKASEGSWTTADGLNISYSNWCPTEPNNANSGEDCTMLGWGGG